MLRASAAMNDTEVSLELVNGEATDGGDVEYANELMEFATALASRDEGALANARDKLQQAAGSEVLVDAAGIAGNFQRMVRIADSIGIPIDEDRLPMMNPQVEQLDLRRFRSSENTPMG